MGSSGSRASARGDALERCPRWRSRVALWWDCNKWFALLTAWVVVLLLGFAGFIEFYAREAAARGEGESPRNALDSFYVALQLYVLESGSVYGSSIGWKLQAARLLAPIIAGATAIQAMVGVYRDNWREYRIRRGSRHVVVCGLGEKGWALVESFRRIGTPVAVVDHDPDNPLAGACREAGAAFLVGDARTVQLLTKANVVNAALLFAMCGDDGTNVVIAQRASSLASGRSGPHGVKARRRPAEPLKCFLHLDDPDVCPLLAAETKPEEGQTFVLRPFSAAAEAADAILNQHYVFGATWSSPDPRAHVLVVGMSAVGRALVLAMARQWRGWHERRDEPLQITLVDPEARARWALFAARYPDEAARCRVVLLEHGAECAEFERGDCLAASEAGDITAVYVCLDDDAAGVQAALRLQVRLGDRQVPVVVCVDREDGLAALLQQRKGADLPRLCAFGVVDHTCTAELLLEDQVETLAEAIHEDYREKASGGSAFPSWHELAPHLKASNYGQARHIPVKLHAVGCILGRGKAPKGDAFGFTDEEVEQLAIMEHHRWVVERLLAGWLPGPAKDRANRITDCLVPWEALPPEEKEKDRDPVRDLPALLAKAGFHIARVK